MVVGPFQKVLVIEDDPDVCDILVLGLEQYGIAVRGAQSAAEGLQIFDKWRADLVILDALLPGFSGLDLIPFLKELSPAPRVLCISGGTIGEEDCVKIAQRQGADATLAKPFTLADVIAQMSRMV